MAKFGRDPFPRRFGGGKRYHEVELEALLDALAPGWDTAEDSPFYAETYAAALGVATIWTVNARTRNQMIPERMLDGLTTWEEACRLRPAPTDTVQARRRAVAAKLRGLAGNTLGDIYDACSTLLGAAFDSIVTDPEASAITYWPGINPGPPGYEWSSTRARIAVRMRKDLLTDAEFKARRAQLVPMLDALIPDWMTFTVGVGSLGSQFIVNQGIVGQTII